MNFFRALGASSKTMVAIIFRYRGMLAAITRVELAKRSLEWHEAHPGRAAGESPSRPDQG